MPPDGFKTQVLLLHSDQGTLDKLEAEFDDRYTVHLATSGSQALSALAEVPIDIFVSSQDLPGMSGIEALREAKSRSPRTLGILFTDADIDEGAVLVGNEEIFQIVRGQVTGEALLRLVENASQQIQLPLLAKSANDATAHADGESDQIVMETADNGASIISQSSVRLRALNPKSFAAAAPVDILVLSTDAEFLETIRSSSRSMHKVHSAATLREADDIIRKHKVGVAVVDAAIVREKIEQLTQYLRREAPRLVSIVAGRRDDGEMLMDLINRGKVYRFLLKPVSSGRARLAVEASVKHHLEAPDTAFVSQDNTEEPPPAGTESPGQVADVRQQDTGEAAVAAPADNEAAAGNGEQRRAAEATNPATATASMSKTGAFHRAELAAAAEPGLEGSTHRFGKLPVIGAAIAALAVLAIGAYFLAGTSDEFVASQTATESTAAPATVAENKVDAVDPAVDPLIKIAETALLEERLRDATDALQRVTALDPANARLPFLSAQLEQAQLRLSLNDARTAIRENRFEDAADALSAAQTLAAASDSTELETLTAELNRARSEQQTDEVLALANASLEAGALRSPPNDNARYYFELVLSNDPDNVAARHGLNVIANRLMLEKARKSAAANRAATKVTAPKKGNDGTPVAAKTDPAAASDPDRPAVDTASDSVATSTTESVPATTADATTPLEAVPAAVSSLVRTNYVAPKYPRNALRRNLTGWVDIEFTVGTDGTVNDVEVRASDPGDVFVSSATRAVKQWEFEPVISDGNVVEKRAAVRMMFSLD